MADSTSKKQESLRPKAKKAWNSEVSKSKQVGEGKLKSLVAQHYQRKQILSAESYEKAHPDKAFCWVNYPKLQQNSFFHENGWRPFVPTEHIEDGVKDQFSSETSYGVKGVDNLVHRSEMVLCWMPKEEHDEMKLAEELARKVRDNTDLFKNNPGLANFQPSSERTAGKLDESEL